VIIITGLKQEDEKETQPPRAQSGFKGTKATCEKTRKAMKKLQENVQELWPEASRGWGVSGG